MFVGIRDSKGFGITGIRHQGSAVRIHYRREGGLAYLPGLQKPVTIDADTLPAPDHQQLEQLIASAQFFQRPATVGSPRPGAADYHRHTVTVEDGGRSHTVRITEPVEDPSLRALLDFIRARA